ncbi:MAG: DUF2723 domain-containing protein [Elusimicrobiota bacterium]|jgi:Flp pilus assembly protein TadD
MKTDERPAPDLRAPVGTALFAGVFATYLASAYPTLSPYRDSGDLAAAALTLGVAHPPGYPLYALLGRTWLWLCAAGNPAYRLHALSALLGALAALALYLALTRRPRGETPSGRDLLSAACAALLLALAPAFRHLCVVSEMYSLLAFFGALVVLLLSPVGPPPAERAVCAAALALGVGAAGHQTLLGAGVLLLAAAPPRARAEGGVPWRLWGLCALFIGAGLLLFAYLPVRSWRSPVLDWGEPRSLEPFLRMLVRADYGGVRLHPERPAGLLLAAGWLDGLRLSARIFVSELGWAGALLLFWGALRAFSGGEGPSRRRLALAALAAFLLSGPLFIVWANLDPALPETYAILEPHLMLPLLFAALLAGLALRDLLRRWTSPAALAVLLALVAAGWSFPRGDAAWSRRGDYTAWDYGHGLLSSLPPGALLVDPDDPTAFTLSYLLQAHGLRPDVTPFLYFRTRWGYEQFRRRHPALVPSGEALSGQAFYAGVVGRALADGRPLRADLPQKAPNGLRAFPLGLSYRLSPATPTPAESARLVEESLRLHALLRRHPAPAREDFFSRHTSAYWASALNNLGIEVQRSGRDAEAGRVYLRALSIGPWLPEAWNNRGNAALAGGDLAAAEGCYRASLRERESSQVRYNLGRALLLGARYPEAEAVFSEAAKAGVVDAANDLGLVYLRTGRAEDAVAQWLRLLDRAPRYPNAYYNLSLAYAKLGDRARARAALEAYRSLETDPSARAEAESMLQRL